MAAFRAEDRSSERARRWIDEENARRQSLASGGEATKTTAVQKTPTDTGDARDAPVPTDPDEVAAELALAENARYLAEGTQSLGGPPPVRRATTKGARTEGPNRRM
jgi:hypothetical protein